MRLPDADMRDDELARELRAMRPEIDPGFAAKLDAWAADGFPAAGEPPAPARGSWLGRIRLRPTLPQLAVAASVLFALVVSVGVVSSLDGTGSDDDSGGGGEEVLESGRTGAAAEQGSGAERLQETEGDASVVAPEPTTVPPFEPPIRQREPIRPGEERIQERNATMTLSAEPDEVAEVADGVIEVTERYDGIVVSSEVNTSSERGRASFDLRIPTQNLQATLADLSDLAGVSERNEGTLDVTAPFVSAEERFADAKAEVDALVAQLQRAGSADEIAQVREQLRIARGELAAVRAELASLKQRAEFSTLGVTVVGDGDADGRSLGDAADDAVNVLEDLGGATLIALAVIVPLGVICLGVWVVYSMVRRRRRNQALDE